MNLALDLAMWVWAVGVGAVLEKCGFEERQAQPDEALRKRAVFTVPPTSHDSFGQSSCTGPPLSSTDPVATLETGEGLRKMVSSAR